MAYDEYWADYPMKWQAFAWTVVASLIVTIAFVGTYLAGTAVAGAHSSLASTGAFVLTYFGSFLILSRRSED